MDSDRKDSVNSAKLANKLQRYDDVVKEMRSVARMEVDLTREEMELLAAGYRGIIRRRRESWGVLSKIKENPGDKYVEEIKLFKGRVENEISMICKDILSILEQHLIPSSSISPDSFVYLYTLKGDYYRYLTEFQTGTDREEAVQESLQAYETAMAKAETQLSRADPYRVRLDLNLAVLYHDALHKTKKACMIANDTVFFATLKLSELTEAACKESSKTLQILDNNFKMWKSGKSDGACSN